MNTHTYTNRTDQTILESGIAVRDEDRDMLAQAATRETNMIGGRYSDALRANLATYARLGPDAFRKLHDDATRVARQIGY